MRVKVTDLLDLEKRSLFTKSLFSQFFGQKLAFLMIPTYIQLSIAKEPNKVETNFFFLMKVESLFFLLIVSVFT